MLWLATTLAWLPRNSATDLDWIDDSSRRTQSDCCKARDSNTVINIRPDRDNTIDITCGGRSIPIIRGNEPFCEFQPDTEGLFVAAGVLVCLLNEGSDVYEYSCPDGVALSFSCSEGCEVFGPATDWLVQDPLTITSSRWSRTVAPLSFVSLLPEEVTLVDPTGVLDDYQC